MSKVNIRTALVMVPVVALTIIMVTAGYISEWAEIAATLLGKWATGRIAIHIGAHKQWMWGNRLERRSNGRYDAVKDLGFVFLAVSPSQHKEADPVR